MNNETLAALCHSGNKISRKGAEAQRIRKKQPIPFCEP